MQREFVKNEDIGSGRQGRTSTLGASEVWLSVLALEPIGDGGAGRHQALPSLQQQQQQQQQQHHHPRSKSIKATNMMDSLSFFYY